jgi:hypothetical protein
LFNIKGNLVFMNNLYHKVAVASVCTALSFALGANEEAFSATFTLTIDNFDNFTFDVLDISHTFFGVETTFDGRGDKLFPAGWAAVMKNTYSEGAEITEFNIGSFFLAPNTVISNAVFQTNISPRWPHSFVGSLGIFGYVGNGRADNSDFEAGVLLSSVDISSLSPGDTFKFDVTQFVNQRVGNRDAFAGFAIRALNLGPQVHLGGGEFDEFKNHSSLIIETADVAEPVPEPTTIFGSAIGLCLGGWLKRKKSTPQNKAKSQA